MSTPNGRRLPSGWFQLPRNIAQTPTLSITAKGLYVYLLSFPDNWEFYFSKIERDCGIGRDKRIALFNELEAHGLITQGKIRYPNGRFGYDFTVGDPVADFVLPPCPEKPETVEPKTVASGLIENNTPNREFILRESPNGASPAEEEEAPPAPSSPKSPSSVAPRQEQQRDLRGSKGQLSAKLENSKPRPLGEDTDLMGAIDDVCATDRTALMPLAYQRWVEAYYSLVQQGATATGVRNWAKWYLRQGKWKEVEYQQDWRGKQNQRQTPAIISETYTAFKRDVERVKKSQGVV